MPLLVRFLRVVLILCIAFVCACGGDDARPPAAILSGPPADASTDASSASIDSGTPINAPTITSFTAAKAMITSGESTTLAAIFSGGAGTINNGVGSVTSGVSVPTGVLTSTTTFELMVVGDSGLEATQLVTVVVVDAPTITSFAAAKSPVTTGNATTLTAVFTGGTASINQGIAAVASGDAVSTGALTADTVYTLTVTNALGASVTANVAIDVVDAPVIASFTAASSPIAAGQATELTATFTGGTGVVNQGIGALPTGSVVSSGTLSADKTFRLTVTNAAGDSVTSDVTVNVIVGPWIKSFTAASGKISRYTSTTLTPVFYGGTASIDQGIGAVTSGVAKATGKVRDKTTFTLTVTDASGNTASATTVVDVQKEIFVANWGQSEIVVFDEDTPNNSPLAKRVIRGPYTQLEWPSSMQVVGDELFVSDRTQILVFDAAADGLDVTPKRTIGSWPKLASHFSTIAVVDGEIFVSSSPDRVDVYAVGDAGAVAPKRSLGGSTTLLHGTVGLAVDSGELFVANIDAVWPGIAGLTVYSAMATGDVAPIRSGNFYAPHNVVINGGELIVVGQSSITTMDKSSFTKVREIDLSSPGSPSLWACAILGSELACTTRDFQTPIFFWPLSANGKVAPTRTFSSSALKEQKGICVH